MPHTPLPQALVPALPRLVKLGITDHHYPVKNDHGLLWEIAQSQPVICIISLAGAPSWRDIAATVARDGLTEITSHGLCYAYGRSKAEFIRQCQERRVEFLVAPNPSARAAMNPADIADPPPDDPWNPPRNNGT